MVITQHASTRLKGRGISIALVTLIEQLGIEFYLQGESTWRIELDHKTAKRLSKQLRHLAEQIDKRIYVVVEPVQNTLITAAIHYR